MARIITDRDAEVGATTTTPILSNSVSGAAAPVLLGSSPAVAQAPSAGAGLALDLQGRIPTTVAQFLSGAELAYTSFVGNLSVTATSSATAQTVVSAASVALDGTSVILVEFWCIAVKIGTSVIRLELFDGTSSVGMFVSTDTAGSATVPVYFRARLTPLAGDHTYKVGAYVDAGTGSVYAGAGGAAVTNAPGYIRITRA